MTDPPQTCVECGALGPFAYVAGGKGLRCIPCAVDSASGEPEEKA